MDETFEIAEDGWNEWMEARAKKGDVLMRFVLYLAVVVFLAVVSIVATVLVFKGTHFWVMDGLGDAREMMGDGPLPSWWSDFWKGWFLGYIPAVLLGVFSLSLIVHAVGLVRCRWNGQ